MKRPDRLRVVVAVALLLAAPGAVSGAALTGPAQAADDGLPGDPSDGSVEPMTACFTGDGYPISIGETGATLDALVHLSVLTDPAVGNEFGIEAAGTLEDDSIVTLAAGVRLTAREAIADGVDPFAAFDILYTYELRLPMFSGSIDETEYRDSGSPFRSSAGVVPC
ncbi:hypothetical protein EXE53_18805 [Halorubrum sp. SD626R]|uniref:DUF7332 family protein n=1 Tax=Halorubrum TaxID=56688 RepID=UPI0010F6E4F6|nr:MULTISPECIES: hypothetical protein [Halorubrum]TKX78883.1 hypothetical protein EXE53_18805 [Halorubrum sp. SD626R]